MAGRESPRERPAHAFTVQVDSPLIGVVVDNSGREEVAYFVDEVAADQVLQQEATQPAIKLAGVWSDLDGDAMLEGLDRLRHDVTPTPPVTSI